MGIPTRNRWYEDPLRIRQRRYLRVMQQLAKIHAQPHSREPSNIGIGTLNTSDNEAMNLREVAF